MQRSVESTVGSVDWVKEVWHCMKARDIELSVEGVV